jgi:hypothetical protein
LCRDGKKRYETDRGRKSSRGRETRNGMMELVKTVKAAG